jgi:hypothetical protein
MNATYKLQDEVMKKMYEKNPALNTMPAPHIDWSPYRAAMNKQVRKIMKETGVNEITALRQILATILNSK